MCRGDLSIPAAELRNALVKASRQQKLKYENLGSAEASGKTLKLHFYTLQALLLSALFSTPLAPQHAWCADPCANRLLPSQLKSSFQIGYKDSFFFPSAFSSFLLQAMGEYIISLQDPAVSTLGSHGEGNE